MTKLSIIVPVYNVEKYIRPCIESIFKQGLDENDFEVIIVNDGSTDRSMEMIEEIISQHNNIIVINQENLGISVARNNGIAAAKGDYILMPDSDDLLIENSLKPLLEKALETKADLVVADYLKMSDEEIDSLSTIPQNDFVFQEKTGEETFLEVLNPNYCYVWRTLYRKEFLTSKNISFVPNLKYEDILFTHECYLKAKCCIKTNILLYIYRRWFGSLTNAYTIDNSRHYIIALSKTWNLRQIEGHSSDMLYKLEEDVYMLFRMMLYHTIHCVKRKTDRNGIIDSVNHYIPDLNFKHGIQQRLITMMTKKMPHFFINFYYQYAQIAYQKDIKIWKKIPQKMATTTQRLINKSVLTRQRNEKRGKYQYFNS